jgi:hypothetical protein
MPVQPVWLPTSRSHHPDGGTPATHRQIIREAIKFLRDAA